MNVSIRKAVKEDCERLLELVKELAVYERAPAGSNGNLVAFTESGFGPQPVWWALAVEVNGVIEGFAMYYIRFSTWKGQRMYLEDFIVSEKMRGKGLGKLLFDSLIEEAKEKGFAGIQWQVLDWNEPAINFYKKYNAWFDSEWINCGIAVSL